MSSPQSETIHDPSAVDRLAVGIVKRHQLRLTGDLGTWESAAHGTVASAVSRARSRGLPVGLTARGDIEITRCRLTAQDAGDPGT
jgi:hypothetical protein